MVDAHRLYAPDCLSTGRARGSLVERLSAQTALRRLAALILVITMGSLAYRNNYYLNIPSVFSSGWLNRIYAESGKSEIKIHITLDGVPWYYVFASPSINKSIFWPFSNWTSSRARQVHVFVDTENGEDDWRNSYEKNRVTGDEHWRLVWENILFVMFGDSWPENDQNYLLHRITTDFRWPWMPLFLLVVATSLWRWHDTLQRPLLPILIISWFLLQACSLLVVNEGRYRKPMEGLLIAQWMVIIDQKRQRARPRLLASDDHGTTVS
ncbi:hypothetical protein CCP3SC1_960014 [Gammaproteobacteria bacterium]